MPELPEVETVVRTLRPLITGRVISDVQVLWPRTLQSAVPECAIESVCGQVITGVERRAKYIVIQLASQARVTVHLRMTGELLFVAGPSGAIPERQLPYLRAAFQLDRDAQLLFFDVRKFGRIQVLTPTEWSAFTASLGVEPLSAEFTSACLRTLLRQRKRQLKPLLLDQTLIAGLGNIYVDESLFRTRLHPLQPSDLVSARKATELHNTIVTMLEHAIAAQGTTLRDYRGGAGQEGSFQRQLLVYGSPAGWPCPRCGTALARTVVGQRGTVYCPRCQRPRTTPGTPRR